MSICSSCGRSVDDLKSGGAITNSEGEIVIRVPERHFYLFRKTFREMETRLGMYGYGELANMLKPYGKLFDQNFEVLRYFDDGALAMATTGIVMGHQVALRIQDVKAGNGRLCVYADFSVSEGKTVSLKLSDAATPEAAERFQEYFSDLRERLSPAGAMSGVEPGEPEE